MVTKSTQASAAHVNNAFTLICITKQYWKLFYAAIWMLIVVYQHLLIARVLCFMLNVKF